MKKIFTFLMTVLVFAACFAQTNKYEVIGLSDDMNMDRSSWKGWYTAGGYVHVQPAESEYFLYLPAGTFDTTVDLTMVRFYTIPSANISNYGDDEPEITLDNNFEVRIYTGAYVDGLDFHPGTVQDRYTYNPAAIDAGAGAQVVHITPFTVNPGDSIAIGIYSDDISTMGLCDPDATDACADLNFALWPEYDDAGIHHYYYTGLPKPNSWAYQGQPVNEHDPWNLSVFYNDGQPYVRQCDWEARFFNPENIDQTNTVIDHWAVDEFTDSLWVKVGMYNGDLDTCVGDVEFSLWIIDEEFGELYSFDHYKLGPEEEEYDTLAPRYGWTLPQTGGIALLSVEENYEEFSWPIQMCLQVWPNCVDGYEDPDTTNNKICIPVGRDEDFEGVKDNNAQSLSIVPNPASTTITINNVAGSQIFVYNIAGQEVMSVENAKADETLNVSNLNTGLYIVRVVNGDKVSSAKVSIVR